MNKFCLLISAAVTLLCVSCASMYTSQSQYVEAEAFVSQGNYGSAATTIEESRGTSYQEKDRVLFYLDIGMLYHYAGEYEKSNSALTEAEYAIEELYTQSISKAIGSALLNDNALEYNGEVYEDLYINIFKSLNYIALDDPESALVEVRRVNNKLNLLQDKYDVMYNQYSSSDENRQAQVSEITNEFHNDALARYLGCILFRNMGDYDDARIDKEFFTSSYKSQPELYPFPGAQPPDINPTDSDTVPVNFLSFTGQAPNKVASTFYIDSKNDVIYFTAVEQSSENYMKNLASFNAMYIRGIGSGFHLKMEFPRMGNRGSRVDQIQIFADDILTANLILTEDMEHVAKTTFKKELPLIIGKTITRALIKGIAKEATDKAIDKELDGRGLNLLKSIFDTATDIVVDATENADLRISNFFPAKAYTGEVFMDPGIYDFRIEYYNNGHLLFTDYLGEREINKNKSIIESFYLF
jgi:hypothetical protein